MLVIYGIILKISVYVPTIMKLNRGEAVLTD